MTNKGKKRKERKVKTSFNAMFEYLLINVLMF